LPIKKIDDDAQIQPAVFRWQRRDVGNQGSIWQGNIELPIQDILRHWFRVSRIIRYLKLFVLFTHKIMQPHEPGYTIMPNSHTLILEFLPYPGTAISSPMPFLDCPNLLHKGSILLSSCRYRSFSPCVVVRCTYSKHPRHLLDRPLL